VFGSSPLPPTPVRSVLPSQQQHARPPPINSPEALLKILFHSLCLWSTFIALPGQFKCNTEPTFFQILFLKTLCRTYFYRPPRSNREVIEILSRCFENLVLRVNAPSRVVRQNLVGDDEADGSSEEIRSNNNRGQRFLLTSGDIQRLESKSMLNDNIAHCVIRRYERTSYRNRKPFIVDSMRMMSLEKGYSNTMISLKQDLESYFEDAHYSILFLYNYTNTHFVLFRVHWRSSKIELYDSLTWTENGRAVALLICDFMNYYLNRPVCSAATE
jgi:hypothetical protein